MTEPPPRANPVGNVPADVRMRGFTHRTTVEMAWQWMDARGRTLEEEPVGLVQAAGRVLARDIVSNVSVPLFPRAMMDGYAVQAADTQGAAPYQRLPLQVIGELLPGVEPSQTVRPGQAIRIMTGACLPAGADAVLPVERTESEAGQVYALDVVTPGKNVGEIGEDILAGQQVLSRGRRLRPQDVGVLSSIGIPHVPVIRRPRVRVIVTGNELLPPGSQPFGQRIVDANSPMLMALVERDGGIPIHPGLVPDRPDAIWEAFQDDADLFLVSGGSSVGQEDHAPLLLAQHGELAIHGIAMRPSSPTGIGQWNGRLVILLPGNPVSCLCAYDFFAGRAIRTLGGRSPDWPYRRTCARLARKLVSTVGRVDYARVRWQEDRLEPLAISGASMLSSTTRADGFVIISEDSEGFPADAEVEVFLYES
jgi:molybdopterin molybdotransferase